MAASFPAVKKGRGSASASVAEAGKDHSCASMAALAGSAKQTPPEGSILHVADLPIKKRIQLIDYQEAAAAEIRTDKKKRSQPMNQQETAKNQLVCDICDRTFASSRSVAIHKGHHIRRDRARVQEQEAAENPSDRMLSGQRQAAARRRRPSDGPGAAHQCRRCGRSFVSGQALGAHKRHCTWPPVEQEIVNNFDLNEVPPPEEEDILALPWHY